MNVFYVDSCPYAAARSLVDKHVVKMVVESAQLLSTAHRVLDGRLEVVQPEFDPYSPHKLLRRNKIWVFDDDREDHIYRATHVGHPCAKWARGCAANYIWLFMHFTGLMDEYAHRYGRRHKCEEMMSYLVRWPAGIKQGPMTPVPVYLPEELKVDGDPVDSYRSYYRRVKAHLFSYTNREPPFWWPRIFEQETTIESGKLRS